MQVWAPGDAFGDVLLALPVIFMVAHFELRETFPVFLRAAPQVLDSRVAVFSERDPIPCVSETQRYASCAKDRWVAEDWLAEDLVYACRVQFGEARSHAHPGAQDAFPH